MRRDFMKGLAGLGLLGLTGAGDSESGGQNLEDDSARAFELSEVIARRKSDGRAYLSFLDVPTLSMGIYFLQAGAEDKQSPHDQDEIYLVHEGRGVLRVEDKDFPAQPGTLLFVAAKAKHRFHSITEDLTLLVFFSKAPI